MYLGLGSVVVAIFLGTALSQMVFEKNRAQPLPEARAEVQQPIIPLEEAYPHVIKPRSTLFSTLRELHVSPQTIQKIVETAKPIQNLARLQSGIRFQISRASENESDINGIQFRFSAIEMLSIQRGADDNWIAEKVTEEVDLNVVSYSGLVSSSLWESAQRAKMDPNLISELADIFGWEVDFSREVRQNDRWRLTVEQKMVKGQAIGWGAILAAEYINAGTSHQAALFRLNGEEVGYFTPQGESLRKVFLKSPIRYGRITSGFKLRRFHPVLRINRPHRGVDYAAPIGTPVRAVGDGTVIHAAMSGGGGNVIKIRHNATYQTAYKHLSGYAKGIHNGSRVQQGQVIGYSGNTGLSTGPHLHFEFYQAGQYIDPLGKKFPSADPVADAQKPQFQAEAVQMLSALPAWNSEKIDLGSRAANFDPQ